MNTYTPSPTVIDMSPRITPLASTSKAKKTATKKQVVEFAEQNNIDWWVQKNGWNDWDYEIELIDKNNDSVDCGVRAGIVERYFTPTAAEMWYTILQEMKELVK